MKLLENTKKYLKLFLRQGDEDEATKVFDNASKGK